MIGKTFSHGRVIDKLGDGGMEVGAAPAVQVIDNWYEEFRGQAQD